MRVRLSTATPRIKRVTGDTPVTPLELFFDLVFVYALTQVTSFINTDLSAAKRVRTAWSC